MVRLLDLTYDLSTHVTSSIQCTCLSNVSTAGIFYEQFNTYYYTEQCPDLTNPSSGTVTSTSDGYVTIATFSCLAGYYISGAYELTCDRGGTWDNVSPTCSK